MKERILDVLKRTLEIDNADENTSQKNCSKWDSIHHLSLVIELETEFDVSFEPEEIGEMHSFFEIENLLIEKLK